MTERLTLQAEMCADNGAHCAIPVSATHCAMSVSGAKLSVRVLEPWMDLSTAQTSTDDCAEVSLTNRPSLLVATSDANAEADRDNCWLRGDCICCMSNCMTSSLRLRATAPAASRLWMLDELIVFVGDCTCCNSWLPDELIVFEGDCTYCFAVEDAILPVTAVGPANVADLPPTGEGNLRPSSIAAEGATVLDEGSGSGSVCLHVPFDHCADEILDVDGTRCQWMSWLLDATIGFEGDCTACAVVHQEGAWHDEARCAAPVARCRTLWADCPALAARCPAPEASYPEPAAGSPASAVRCPTIVAVCPTPVVRCPAPVARRPMLVACSPEHAVEEASNTRQHRGASCHVSGTQSASALQ